MTDGIPPRPPLPQTSPPQFASPGVAPSVRIAPPPVYAERRRPALGVVALIVGLVALIGSTVVVSIAAFRVGLGAGSRIAERAATADVDWSVLSSVRDWVLLGELSFWVGTALGLWALVQGIVAIVKNSGRGAGIAAVACAVAAPAAWTVALSAFLTLGLGAGTSIGG